MKVDKKVGHERARKEQYPDFGDQFDAIFNGFLEFKKQGVRLGKEADDWVLQIQSIKSKHKKNENNK